MSAHPTLKTAVEEAVSAAGQPPTVAKRLNAWLDALSEGSADLNEEWEEALRSFELLLTEITPDEVGS